MHQVCDTSALIPFLVALVLQGGLLAQPVGNTPNNPITLTLTQTQHGVWVATATANNRSANGYTNVYEGSSSWRGRPGNDVFFKLTLPTCFDSMRVRTCGSTFDTYLHIINTSLGQPDTAVNDDNRATCTSTGNNYIPSYSSYKSAEWAAK